MEPLTILLLVLLAVAAAAIIILLIRNFSKMDDVTREVVLDRLEELVHIVMDALKDGKIEQAELKTILGGLIRVIAAIKGDYVSAIAAKYGADEIE